MKDRPLHVLIFSSWFPTDAQPFLGNFVVQQAKTLAQEYQVTVFRLLEIGAKDTVLQGETSFSVCTAYYQPSKNPLLRYLNKRKAMKAVLKQVSSIDLIHAHVSYPSGWVMAYLKRKLKKPLLLTEHGSYFRSNFKWDFKFTWSIYLAHKSADQLVAVSNYLRKDILKRVYGKQVEVVFNPVVITASRRSKTNEVLELLHISTLDEVKNVAPIFEAIANLKKEGRRVRLTVVSDEDSSKEKLKVNQLGISDCVVFEGPVAHADIDTFYKNADVFILNSQYESFSIVVAEAWTNGIPVISTSVGIADEMSPKLGVLTNGTAPSIQAAITEVMENYQSFDSEEIMAHAQQFSAEAFLKRIKGIYDTLLK